MAESAHRAGVDTGVTVIGGAVIYRLFDIGAEVYLDEAFRRLSPSAPERVRPVRGEAQALQIPNPPVTAVLGSERIRVSGAEAAAEVSARIYDFGVVSLRARVQAPGPLPWDRFTAFGLDVGGTPAIPELLEAHVRRLVDQLGPAIDRPRIADVREEYRIYRIHEMKSADAGRPAGHVVGQLDLVPLLLAETRPLSADAQKELLPNRFSYYADDLTILSWESALVLDAFAGETDIEYVLEFANAQLLELRYYDTVLDGELPRLYDRIEQARRPGRRVLGARYGRLLASMQAVVAETTEVVERAENALKLTDDVYLARVYLAALELFRGRTWRTGIDRKLMIIRETYAMLNAEAQARRGETLELAIIVLIAVEIVLSLFRLV